MSATWHCPDCNDGHLGDCPLDRVREADWEKLVRFLEHEAIRARGLEEYDWLYLMARAVRRLRRRA